MLRFVIGRRRVGEEGTLSLEILHCAIVMCVVCDACYFICLLCFSLSRSFSPAI